MPHLLPAAIGTALVVLALLGVLELVRELGMALHQSSGH